MTQCRAATRSGHQCTRKAVVNADLNREWKIHLPSLPAVNLPIPKLQCCVLCTQHMNELLHIAGYGLMQMMLERAAGPDVRAANMVIDPMNQRSVLKRVYESLVVR